MRKPISLHQLLLFTAILLFSSCQRNRNADELIVGKIWTGNPEQPWAEAMAISGDSIVYVGTITGAEKLAGKETKRTVADTADLIVPLLGIYAAVTRRTIDDKNLAGWIP